jgi:hypothetical protein
LQARPSRRAEQLLARKYRTAKAKTRLTRPHLQARLRSPRDPLRVGGGPDRVAPSGYVRRTAGAHGDTLASTRDAARPTCAERADRCLGSPHRLAVCSFATAAAALADNARPRKNIARDSGRSVQTAFGTLDKAAFASAFPPPGALGRARMPRPTEAGLSHLRPPL